MGSIHTREVVLVLLVFCVQPAALVALLQLVMRWPDKKRRKWRD
jgi:hypothetical protein